MYRGAVLSTTIDPSIYHWRPRPPSRKTRLQCFFMELQRTFHGGHDGTACLAAEPQRHQHHRYSRDTLGFLPMTGYKHSGMAKGKQGGFGGHS